MGSIPCSPHLNAYAFMVIFTAIPMGLLTLLPVAEGYFKGIKFIQFKSSGGYNNILNN